MSADIGTLVERLREDATALDVLGLNAEADNAREAADALERMLGAVEAEREACALLVEQIGDPDDESDTGEEAARAFNDRDRQPMSARLEAWNRVIACAIRARSALHARDAE